MERGLAKWKWRMTLCLLIKVNKNSIVENILSSHAHLVLSDDLWLLLYARLFAIH